MEFARAAVKRKAEKSLKLEIANSIFMALGQTIDRTKK